MRTRLLINHFDISIADELFVRDSFCGGLIMRFIFKIFEVDQEIYGNVLFLYSTVLVFCNVKVYKYAAIMDKEQNMDTLKKLKLKIQIHGYLRKTSPVIWFHQQKRLAYNAQVKVYKYAAIMDKEQKYLPGK
uniref:Uncharacterized protein n=1 Tax=Lactuca sativa TaxID=4236 RepID=A0A9R1VFM1_LACSA|nr:hypothetical protein LSAT_V11C500290810 [Lactuca sativa]